MKKLIQLFLIAMSAYPCMAQDFPSMEDSRRLWSEGPLTWNDFQVRHLPPSVEDKSDLDWMVNVETEPVRKGNVRFFYRSVNLSVDRLLSWYDPDRADDVTLRYHQLEFDIAEIICRQYQNALNAGNRNRPDYDYFQRQLDSRYEALEQETGKGTDTAVIAQYEKRTALELSATGINEPAPPSIEKNTFGVGLFIGYEHQQFFGPVSESIGPFECFNAGLDLYSGKLSFDFGISVGDGGKVMTDGFHFDSKNSYSWEKGKDCRGGAVCLNLGYLVLDRQYWKLTPFAGIGTQFFNQKTGLTDEKNNNEITSEIKALRLAAGVMTDWKIRQWISNTDTTDFFLRLTASCSYGSFSTLGNVWAFNIGLACGFEAWSLNLKRQAL